MAVYFSPLCCYLHIRNEMHYLMPNFTCNFTFTFIFTFTCNYICKISILQPICELLSTVLLIIICHSLCEK